MPGIADLIIVLVLLGGLYLGLARGLYGPLATEGALVASIVIVSRLHTGVDSFLPVPARVAVSSVLVMVMTFLLRLALSPIVGLLQRNRFTGIIDRPAGSAVHGLVAALLLYLCIGLVLDFDRNVYPLLQAGVLTAHQLQDYSRAVDQRPWLSGFVDRDALRRQQAVAASQPVTVNTVARVEGFLNFYLQDIRDPMLNSRLAPIINSLGSLVPVIGHHRPYLSGAPHQ